jgi:hypothetical protein
MNQEKDPFAQPPNPDAIFPSPDILEGKKENHEVALSLGDISLPSEVVIAPDAQLGVINGQFNVHRSDGTVEQGWALKTSTWKDKKTGKINVTIEKPDPDSKNGGVLVKVVPAGEFLDWQEDDESASEKSYKVKFNSEGQTYDNSFPVASTGFNVLRNNGTVENDWEVENITPDVGSGKTFVTISKIDQRTGDKIKKKISTDKLKEWQSPESEKPNPNLIDSVPKNEEEAKKMRLENEEMVRRQKVEANAPRIAELQARMDFIRGDVGEDESQLLWQYGSYNSQRQEFARKGDSDNDNYFRKIAEDVLGQMKPETAKYRNEYWAILEEKHALQFPK